MARTGRPAKQWVMLLGFCRCKGVLVPAAGRVWPVNTAYEQRTRPVSYW